MKTFSHPSSQALIRQPIRIVISALLVMFVAALHAETIRYPITGKHTEIQLTTLSKPITLTVFKPDSDLTIIGEASQTFSCSFHDADEEDEGFLVIDTSSGTAHLQLGGEQLHSALSLILPQDTSLKIRAHDGHVSVEDIHADVEVFATDGDVWLEKLHGSVSATLKDGDLRLKMASCKNCKNLSLSTSDGDIYLHLPQGCPTRLKARAMDGEISCTLPYPTQSVDGTNSNKARKQIVYSDQLSFETDPDGIPVLLSSADGDIYIDGF